MQTWRSYRYKNVTFLILCIIVAIVFSRTEHMLTVTDHVSGWGYVGAFIAGVLFVSSFTVAMGSVLLFILAKDISPLEMGIIAGLGAVFGDFLVFRFVKDNLSEELEPLYNSIGGNHLNKILHTRYFAWTLPVVGAAIIASPLPDEVGVSLMGIAKMQTYKFMLLSFILNATGIFLVVSASSVL